MCEVRILKCAAELPTSVSSGCTELMGQIYFVNFQPDDGVLIFYNFDEILMHRGIIIVMERDNDRHFCTEYRKSF